MSLNVVQNKGTLDYYKDALLPVYQEICGEVETYIKIEDNFEQFLRSNPNNPLYNEILGKNAHPRDAVKIFREFLADGLNCYGAKIKIETADTIHIQKDKIVSSGVTAPPESEIKGIVRSIANAESLSHLYEAWLKFRMTYFDSIERLYGLLRDRPNSASRYHSDGRIRDERIKNVANHTQSLAKEALSALEGLPFLSEGEKPEVALIMAQRSIILSLDRLVSKVIASSDSTTFSDFQNVLKRINNPLLWIYNVFFARSHVLSYFKRMNDNGINLRLWFPEDDVVFLHEKPRVLQEAIERLFLEITRKKGAVIEFSFDDTHKALIIASNKPFELDANHNLSSLLGELKSSLYEPTFLEKVLALFFAKSLTYFVLIPLSIKKPVKKSGSMGSLGSPSQKGGLSGANSAPSNVQQFAAFNGRLNTPMYHYFYPPLLLPYFTFCVKK